VKIALAWMKEGITESQTVLSLSKKKKKDMDVTNDSFLNERTTTTPVEFSGSASIRAIETE
jgi:hypothetical protein